MNCYTSLTRSQQRLAELISIGRPLTEPEQDELYRALHADYMRKWRAARQSNARDWIDLSASAPARDALLNRLRTEAQQPRQFVEHP